MKEVIALVIAVRDECDGCIAAHARGAARKGATPEQVAEALGVALLMMGGPGTVYGPRAWQAYHEFREPQVAQAREVRASLDDARPPGRIERRRVTGRPYHARVPALRAER